MIIYTYILYIIADCIYIYILYIVNKYNYILLNIDKVRIYGDMHIYMEDMEAHVFEHC